MKHLKRQNFLILTGIILITVCISSFATAIFIKSLEVPLYIDVVAFLGTVGSVYCVASIIKNIMKTYNENIIKIKEYE